MQETQVQFLGQEDSLEEGMATHPSVLAWRIPWTEEPVLCPTLHRVAESDTTKQLTLSLSCMCTEESGRIHSKLLEQLQLGMELRERDEEGGHVFLLIMLAFFKPNMHALLL